jgi:hypothetical protein
MLSKHRHRIETHVCVNPKASGAKQSVSPVCTAVFAFFEIHAAAVASVLP